MTIPQKDADLTPPRAERRPHSIEAHGDTRVDDWYWVRDRNDPALMPLLEAENAYTGAVTAHLEPVVEQIYEEILAHTELTDVTYPAPRGPYAYYSRTIDGLQHPILCRRPVRSSLPQASDKPGEDGAEQVVLDENALAEGYEYLRLGDYTLSEDQRLLAYAIDTTGGELLSVRVRDLEDGSDLDDVVEGAYYGLAFSADNGLLFYTRPDETLRPYQVWRHRLGTEASEDVKVFEEDDERFFVSVETSKDGRLVLVRSSSSTTSEWHYVESSSAENELRPVAPRRQGVLYDLEHHDGDLLILSNDGAENFALFRAPLSQATPADWEVILAERPDVRLEALDVVAGHAVLEERGHAETAVRILRLSDRVETVVEAPPAGTVRIGTNLEFETAAVRYETTSVVQPRTLYELDLSSGTATLLRRQPVPGGYDDTLYRTERAVATSLDGTDVPVTLAWRKDRPEGPGPVLLYGYGAYGYASDPVFNTVRPVFPLLDRGVVYAIAHVRGGEEMGRHWYLDGRLEHKRHSFEDFVSVARFLVEKGWTTPPQLAAYGASAGGLLMGASLNLDPDAFGAIVAEVPFVDALTTMLDPSLPLTTHEFEEWGNPISDPEAYAWIKAYSPYDNVTDHAYPKMLVTGGISDPRVGYFEPVKWVQKLRSADTTGGAHILLQIELQAGHFGPSGRYHTWKKRAFVLAFILDALGVLDPVGGAA